MFGFNTQPPEGGWIIAIDLPIFLTCFNTQPPEGGWLIRRQFIRIKSKVSTRSRPKAAGDVGFITFKGFLVSTRSRPKAAGS